MCHYKGTANPSTSDCRRDATHYSKCVEVTCSKHEGCLKCSAGMVKCVEVTCSKHEGADMVNELILPGNKYRCNPKDWQCKGRLTGAQKHNIVKATLDHRGAVTWSGDKLMSSREQLGVNANLGVLRRSKLEQQLQSNESWQNVERSRVSLLLSWVQSK